MKPELQLRVQRYGWDKAADYYDASWKKQLRAAQDRMLEFAALQSGEQVIETACGTGLMTFRAADAVRPGGHVTATDISESMVKHAGELATQNNMDNVTFRRTEAETLPFEDGIFDVALCGLGLMYVTDPLQAMREKFRVLKPGGRAALAIWGERKNCGWAEIFPIVDRRVASDVCPMFFQQGTGDTLKMTMEMAGFRNIRAERLHTRVVFDSDDHAITAAFSGGPVALAYNKFDPETRQEAHREFLDSIEPYRNETGYKIPGEFVVATGFK